VKHAVPRADTGGEGPGPALRGPYATAVSAIELESNFIAAFFGVDDGDDADDLMAELLGTDEDEAREAPYGWRRVGRWHRQPSGARRGRPPLTVSDPAAIERVALLALQAAYEVVGPDRERVLQLAGITLFLVEPPIDLQAVADRLRPIRRGYGKSTLYEVRKHLRARSGKKDPPYIEGSKIRETPRRRST
jgi:hypothetical protein